MGARPVGVPDSPARRGREAKDGGVPILLVDDQPPNLEALQAILSSTGCRFVLARSADEALVALLRQEFAAIVLDIRMPGMSGLELAQLIKTRKRTQHVPILFLTAQALDDRDVLRGYEVGAVDYLTKPINPLILRTKIAVFCDLYLKSRALAEANQNLELRVEQRTAELREAESRLADELADAQLLQRISAALISENDVQSLYGQIVHAAVGIMGSDFASMQMFCPERGEGGELRLLASHGFSEQAQAFWEWVDVSTASSCGAALRSRERIIVPDIEQCAFLADTSNLVAYREAAIRSMQTTPLLSRSGKLVGMISTHWHALHVSPERDLRLLDILARQAADVLERKQVEDALRDADRKKDEFLAMLAHELRNPLAPIRTALHHLRVTGDKPGVLEYVRPMMERQVGHMVRLIDDLLDVSRITSGKIHLQRQRSLLGDLVQSAVEANRVLIGTSELQLRVSVPSEPVSLDVDPTRFVQILSNLVHNAVKFTPVGGCIDISAAIAGAGDGERSGLTLKVRDTGMGISPEALHSIFDLFTQGDQSAQRAPGGLGIGLALARRLAEMHGGSIEAHSAGVGQGSEFTLWLPVVVDGPTAVVMRAPRSRAALRRRTVVIDDNEDAASTLATLVEVLGGESRTAYDGASGIDAVAQLRPDVVFLDIGMPVMDGYEVCRRIRALPNGADVFIVAVTGWGQEQDKQRTVEVGFDAHLTKPADPAALEELLAMPSRQGRESDAQA